MATTGPAGWDARIYAKAIQYLRHGVDPYAAGIAEQEAFRSHAASRPSEHAPFTYVYSPLTLPLLRSLARLPNWLLSSLFWSALGAGFLLQLWAGFQLAEEQERRWLALLLPAVGFFPGLITDDVILSGNLAYLLYGVVLAAAVPGWKRGRWLWFYLAVLAASVFKVQLLTLLAFPILVGRRQWLPAGGTATAGLLLVAGQARLWPELFREQMQTIRIMFDVIPDFGYGPAGVLGRALWMHGRPYSPATTILYLAFAAALGISLLFLASRVRQNNLSREAWIPVALVGTFLLNPRIMKYDMAAITIPMLLIGWRGLRCAWARFHATADPSRDASLRLSDDPAAAAFKSPARSFWRNMPDARLLMVAATCFLIPNVLTVAGPSWWPVELIVLLSVFAMGAWSLHLSQVEATRELQPVRFPRKEMSPLGTVRSDLVE